MEQLCWKCKNTNRFKCQWFEEEAKLPDYVETKGKFIVKCNKFEKIDNKSGVYKNKEIISMLSINPRTFYRRKMHYLNLFYRLYDKIQGQHEREL